MSTHQSHVNKGLSCVCVSAQCGSILACDLRPVRATPIQWHTCDGDEQSGSAVMDVTQGLSDCEVFLAETFIHINIHPRTSLNTLYILVKGG